MNKVIKTSEIRKMGRLVIFGAFFFAPVDTNSEECVNIKLDRLTVLE